VILHASPSHEQLTHMIDRHSKMLTSTRAELSQSREVEGVMSRCSVGPVPSSTRALGSFCPVSPRREPIVADSTFV
jgi:hypothetical protein